MVDELQKLMSFHSVSNDMLAVSSLIEYVAERLRMLHLEVEVFDHHGVKGLYASTTGERHSKVMLQAHVDVVPGGSEYRREGDNIYGRGCYDMLFAVASYLKLIETLDDINTYDISILLTGDEEMGGANGTSWILDNLGFNTDVCIMPDAGEELGTLSVGAKGMWQFKVVASGKSHHASRPWDGDSASSKLVQFLHELNSAFDDDNREAPTMTISQLQAGTDAINQGTSEARAGIDIRFSDENDYRRIRQAVGILSQRYDIQITYENYGNAYTIDITHPLMQSFIAIYRDTLGQDITTHRSYGSSDARFFDKKKIPVIMLRPDGGGAHGDDEWLSISQWVKFQGIISQYIIETARLK